MFPLHHPATKSRGPESNRHLLIRSQMYSYQGIRQTARQGIAPRPSASETDVLLLDERAK